LGEARTEGADFPARHSQVHPVAVENHQQQDLRLRIDQAYHAELAAERHHHILEAVHRKLARQLEEHVGYVRRPGCRRGQADIVLIFPLGQDHARRRVDQAGKHETLDVRHGIEERFGLFENHRCFLSRGGQAWGTQPS